MRRVVSKQFITFLLIFSFLLLLNYVNQIPISIYSQYMLPNSGGYRISNEKNTISTQSALYISETELKFFDSLNFTEKRRYFFNGTYYHKTCIKYIAEQNTKGPIDRELFQTNELKVFSNYKFLRKKVFKSRPRIIFAFGFEATGHLFLAGSWNRICNANKNLCQAENIFTQIVDCGPQRQRLQNISNQRQLKLKVDNYKSQLLILNTYPGIFQFTLWSN